MLSDIAYRRTTFDGNGSGIRGSWFWRQRDRVLMMDGSDRVVRPRRRFLLADLLILTVSIEIGTIRSSGAALILFSAMAVGL